MQSRDLSETARRLIPVLETIARSGGTITYAELARTAEISQPHSIHKTAEALEELMREDHGAGRPLLAAVAISAKRGGIPAPGFFQLANSIGRYFGPDTGVQAETYHRIEIAHVHDSYRPGAG